MFLVIHLNKQLVSIVRLSSSSWTGIQMCSGQAVNDPVYNWPRKAEIKTILSADAVEKKINQDNKEQKGLEKYLFIHVL